MSISEEFQLGDSAIVIGGSKVLCWRTPKIEGTVTARGKTAVRLKYKGLFGIYREKWFVTSYDSYHIEKTEAL